MQIRKPSRRVTIIGAVTAAGVLAFGGVALASIPDSGGVIHGCYKPQSDGHNSPLGVIDTALSNGHCPSGNTEIDWNQTGPQGPQGPAGADGATGATGAQGPAGPSTAGSTGLDVTEVSAHTFPGTTTSVQCPSSNPYVIGGGGDASDNPGGLGGSEPWDFTTGGPISGAENSTDTYGWITFNINYGGGPATTWAFALCAK